MGGRAAALRPLALVLTILAPPAAAEAPAVAQCLACHLRPDGRLDITGIAALEGLPPEWAIVHEDSYDLDGDGIAGRLRYVTGQGGPVMALYGRRLAAGRLEDFARIAGAAHGIDLSDPAVLEEVAAAFRARSPDPAPPSPEALRAFEARGCAACHVTDTYQHAGRTYAPLSDFLLHDLGDGPVRTAPLWGCLECLRAPGHGDR